MFQKKPKPNLRISFSIKGELLVCTANYVVPTDRITISAGEKNTYMESFVSEVVEPIGDSNPEEMKKLAIKQVKEYARK
jgi:hypothetical protein